MTDRRAEEPSFTSSEGLRRLLARINAEEPQHWYRDPEVRALFEYAIAKYRPICRKWRRDPVEAAAIAFVTLRQPGTANSRDLWAVITTAVMLRIRDEAFGERLLTAPERISKLDAGAWEAPVRAGEYEEFLFGAAADPEELSPAPTLQRIRDVSVELFGLLGWDEDTIATAIDLVLNRLTATANAASAYDFLRRDEAIPALLGIGRASWTGLLRILFDQRADGFGPARPGLIRRIAFAAPTATCAAQVAELLEDADLFTTILEARCGP